MILFVLRIVAEIKGYTTHLKIVCWLYIAFQKGCHFILKTVINLFSSHSYQWKTFLFSLKVWLKTINNIYYSNPRYRTQTGTLTSSGTVVTPLDAVIYSNHTLRVLESTCNSTTDHQCNLHNKRNGLTTEFAQIIKWNPLVNERKKHSLGLIKSGFL